MATHGSRNYTSTVPPSRTAQNIITALGRYGARNVLLMFAENGDPAAISFRVATDAGEHAYRLPVDVDAMLAYLRRQVKDRDIPPRFGTREQAARTAWRTCEDWLTSQLAMVHAGQAKLEQTMLPYMIVDAIGSTVYDRFVATGLKELESG